MDCCSGRAPRTNWIQAITWANIQTIKLSGKPIPKVYILCDSIYTTVMRGQNRNGEQIGGCQGLRREWGMREEDVAMEA